MFGGEVLSWLIGCASAVLGQGARWEIQTGDFLLHEPALLLCVVAATHSDISVPHSLWTL